MVVVAFLFYFNIFSHSEESSFNVNPVFLKFVLKQGESVSTTFDVKNLNLKQDFSLEVINLLDLLSLGENNFVLDEKESKKINLQISDINNIPGVYVGHILVKGNMSEKKIPVIISIHSLEQSFAINLDVASDSKQIESGGETVTEVKFFNLQDTYQHEINVSYDLFDLDGEKIFSESEKITVGSQSSLTKTIPLPGNTFLGDYFFVVTLDYEGTQTTSSYLFSVVNKKKSFSFLDVNLLAFVVVVFIIVVFIFILYMLYERNKLFSNLKSQQKSQIKYYSKGIAKEEKKYVLKAKNNEEKNKLIREFKDAKKKIIGEIKKQHSNQAKELKVLRKKKDNKTAEKKIGEWQKKVYPQALKNAQISQGLKNKLAVLKTAYSEGYIKKDSYEKGTSNIQKKLKRNIYK